MSGVGGRGGGRLGGQAERMLCLGVKFARDLQSISDLVTTDGCGRVGVLLAVDFAVIKPRILQLLLRRFGRGVRPKTRQGGEKKKKRNEEFPVHRASHL